MWCLLVPYFFSFTISRNFTSSKLSCSFTQSKSKQQKSNFHTTSHYKKNYSFKSYDSKKDTRIDDGSFFSFTIYGNFTSSILIFLIQPNGKKEIKSSHSTLKEQIFHQNHDTRVGDKSTVPSRPLHVHQMVPSISHSQLTRFLAFMS